MEKLEKTIISNLIKAINHANNYAEQNDIKSNKFCLGQVDAFLSILECIGHNVVCEFSRIQQWGTSGTHKFERIEKVLMDDKVIFVKNA